MVKVLSILVISLRSHFQFKENDKEKVKVWKVSLLSSKPSDSSLLFVCFVVKTRLFKNKSEHQTRSYFNIVVEGHFFTFTDQFCWLKRKSFKNTRVLLYLSRQICQNTYL